MSDEPDPTRTSRIGGFARRIAVDVTPLRVSRDFRRLWLGLAASTFGSQFTLVATFLQVYEPDGQVDRRRRADRASSGSSPSSRARGGVARSSTRSTGGRR